MYCYKTKGTCSREIDIEVKDNVIESVRFVGGCTGNTTGVAPLAKGLTLDEAISRLKGIQCRNGTSCPDQLARALEAYKAEEAK